MYHKESYLCTFYHAASAVCLVGSLTNTGSHIADYCAGCLDGLVGWLHNGLVAYIICQLLFVIRVF
jgi:hypothetical protein